MDKSKIYMEIGQWTGIGNQMFQYAALTTLSVLKNFEVIIEKKFNYLLDHFTNIKTNQKYTSNINCSNEFVEKTQLYDPNLFNINNKNNIKLVGYFQNINYFNKHKDIIRNIFKFDDYLINHYRSYLQSLKINSNSKIIGIHLRLSDYKTDDINSFLYTFPTLNFINDSISLFDKDNDIFLIFSNDIERVKSIYNLTHKNIYYISEGQIQDLCILSLCDNYILSSSTYGWWGCFLNPNDDKQIIMLYPWFNQTAHGKDIKIDLYFENCKIYDVNTSSFKT
jgi:hypothetical protein